MTKSTKFKIAAIVVLLCLLAPGFGFMTVGLGAILALAAIVYIGFDLVFKPAKKKEEKPKE